MATTVPPCIHMDQAGHCRLAGYEAQVLRAQVAMLTAKLVSTRIQRDRYLRVLLESRPDYFLPAEDRACSTGSVG